jgi:glycosyltransferase A (GT-A) superfamily protein (DUF2064 family)
MTGWQARVDAVVTGTVLLVAKAPVPGRAKTRLVPWLSPDQAAALGRALLLDTLAACLEEAAASGYRVALLHADSADAAELRQLAGPDVELVLQEGRASATRSCMRRSVTSLQGRSR